MLTEIRDRSSGAFAYFIAALIIIPMAFWGVNEYANTQVVPTIVEVGDTKITKNELDQRVGAAQDAERERNPEFANSDFFNSPFYKRTILNSLIDRALVSEMASTNNYRVGNAQLAELIRKEPIFQNQSGQFDQSLYEEFVSSRLYSKQRFEEQIRADSRMSQVTQGYQDSALVLSDEVRALLELQAERRTFDIVTISEAEYRETIEVSEQEIAEYFNNNNDSFMNPDRVSIEYVELDLMRIEEELVIDEEQVRQEYEDNKDNFISPEQRATRHILLSTSDGKSDSEQLLAAEDLVTQLRAGADFAELAKQSSDDSGSAQEGGSLGQIERGQMVNEFEQATFELAANTISDPVKTQFGYHIIEVTEISGGVPQEFADVRFEIESQIRAAEAQTVLAERLLEMRNLVFESESSLQPVADSLGLEIRTTDFFTRETGEGIATNGLIREAAFDALVVEDGLNSDPVELNDGLYVALRKVDFKPAAPKELAEVSEQIKASLVNQGAATAAQAAVETLQSKAEESWEKVVADPELKSYQYTVSLLDEAPVVANDIVQKVSTMHLGGEQAKVDTLRSSNGDFHLIRLTRVSAGNLAQVSDQVKEGTRALVAQRNGSSVFASYLYQLNQEVSQNIDDDAL